MATHLYASRSGAHRAAKAACRKALAAPYYQAAEGPDYEIHPHGPTIDDLLADIYRERYYFKLRGPAAEAAQ